MHQCRIQAYFLTLRVGQIFSNPIQERIYYIFRLGFNRAGYEEAKKISGRFFTSSSSSSSHRIHAVGNCHIDTAWLWPYEETERKAGRSFASAVHLMASYPDFKFVASQVEILGSRMAQKCLNLQCRLKFVTVVFCLAKDVSKG